MNNFQNMDWLTETIILLCAFRYALGRKTYVVSTVSEEILRRWDILTPADKILFAKEILEHEKRFGSLGMKCDAEDWNRIVKKAIEDGLIENSSL